MWSFFSRDPSKDFPFEIGDVIPGLENRSVWTLHKGKKRSNQEEVSVFVLDVHKSNEVEIDIAKASLKKLKTIRHPNLLCYIDSCESDKFIYVATEYVEPLCTYLENSKLESQQNDLFLSWGLFQVTRALSFLNNDGNMKHNNMCLYSVFVTVCGEWKLGGFEFLTTNQQENSPNIKIFPTLNIYDAPERKDSELFKQSKTWSADMWGLGCLIWEIFNGPLKEQPSLHFVKKIHPQISAVYCELVASKPGSRPNPADIITRLRKQGGFFKNPLIDTLLFLEEIQIKDKTEKARFFSNLSAQLDAFPEAVCIRKILPQLLTAFNFGDAGSAVLGPMFKLGRLLDETEYQKVIVPCIVTLFGSNDRTTRSRLLMQLDQFIGHIHNSTVNDQIFLQLANGFLDTNPVIREQTVKSIVHLAPKLNYNNLNVEVLKHFARLQSKDDQGGIRTNTTVCLGKIAAHLHPQIRQKVLVSAFVRATRDPFPPARQAGVLALAATQQYFLLSEVAVRILPALCPLTADPEKQVRDAVFRTIRGFLGKLEKVSEDPSLKEGMEADVNTATPSLSNAAATWAGWAVTAVTAKFYRSHSDTARALHNPHRQMLTKPASLEQPSSSSVSTTTSSVTSMTSLEHSESASDYDPEHWDTGGNWGDMEATVAPVAGNISRSHSSQANQSATGLATLSEDDGWGIDDWGTLEEIDTNVDNAPKESELPSPADSWSGNATWADSGHLSSNNKVPCNDVSSNSVLVSRVNKFSLSDKSEDGMKGWDDGEFEPIEEMNNGLNTNSKMEEMRRKREERKLQRQREMEARRTARTQQGPMKLAAKKN